MLTGYEKETTITYNDAEEIADVYTCNKALMKRLDALCAENTMFIVKKEGDCSKTYQVPKRCVSIRKPTKISVETRAKKASWARELSQKRKNEK